MMDDRKIPTIIERPFPNAVTYDLSTTGHVKITLPESSTWSSGLHWHETHDEYLKVIKGTIRVQLGSTIQYISATENEQPEIKVARYMWHEWQRAVPDGEVIVIERTEPDDNEKAIFFWNLNGVILDAPRLLNDRSSLISRLPRKAQGLALDFWITLNLFVIFNYLDNIPVFLNAPKFAKRSNRTIISWLRGLDWLVSHAILLLASWGGWALGIRPVNRQFTPADVCSKWWSNKKERRNKVA
ncbi:hypothetical protein MRS44_005256 [Fusarium solani]|jgi:uncharacterized RmlC-like cupin family protein|uniref:Cupin, RmlC-type n=1 Tax=Fusarium solani TaxID=169388 RepID=A0A9P9RAH7_FUSSL|nr:uncharacterized protein B0J15DRAFT_533081 [Fusarium solani]KAH7270970.1 hypothetical protein B0J15DRAFT_533081 [Fusarium solani]KAJ3467692.1 hypothetical protein MRS44_005256 [Fusarium solani]KAJ4234661.1 hypothetical protein NW759_001652 [Fusarium solani]